MSAISTSRAQFSKPSVASRRSVVRVQAASWQKVSSTAALAAAGGKLVVEVSGQKASCELDSDIPVIRGFGRSSRGPILPSPHLQQILLADVDGDVCAVSNKCSHLGLPLVGKVSGGLIAKQGTPGAQ